MKTSSSIQGKGLWQQTRHDFDELPSTNLFAEEHLPELSHGEVIYTLNQTAGRGRYDRRWMAPAGTCLTFSLILKDIPIEFRPAIGLAAALAVRAMLSQYNLPSMVKWPNDVEVNRQKICGILAVSTGDALIIGIGINVNVDPEALQQSGVDGSVTSMRAWSGQSHDLETVYDRFCRECEPRVETAAQKGFRSLADEWHQYDSLINEHVAIEQPDKLITGRCRGLDKEGRLVVAADDGMKHIWSGDVTRIRRADH